jgi:hypothetical protein
MPDIRNTLMTFSFRSVLSSWKPVEAGYNTAPVALRVVRGDEKGTQSQMRQ